VLRVLELEPAAVPADDVRVERETVIEA